MVSFGLISTARINNALLAAVEAVSDARVLAVASRDAERARSYAAEHRITRHYGSYEQLLADPEIDAVYVSLPNALHVPWARRALTAGKHVLCEKPLSRDPSEVRELFATASAARLQLAEAFMYRHHPQTALLKELVDSGALGQLAMIRASFTITCDPGDVRLRRALDGGALMDVGCYPVHLARLLAGEPVRVCAEQRLGGDGVDVAMAGVLRSAGDVITHFDCGLTLAPRHQLELVGTGACLRCRAPWVPDGHPLELWRPAASEPELISVPRADPYALELANFCAAVRGDAEPLLGVADAVGQARALQALYRAAGSGQRVDL